MNCLFKCLNNKLWIFDFEFFVDCVIQRCLIVEFIIGCVYVELNFKLIVVEWIVVLLGCIGVYNFCIFGSYCYWSI